MAITPRDHYTMIPSSPVPPVYAIVDAGSIEAPDIFIRELFRAGARLVQIRAKNATFAELLQLTELAIEIRAELGLENQVRIIVNDLPEVCLAAKADGVHLGQTDCSPAEARTVLGPQAIIGLSTHSIEQIKIAAGFLADSVEQQAVITCSAKNYCGPLNYLALGPIFLSSTKSGHAEVVGLETLRNAVKISPLALVAIGGINSENAASVFDAGATSVALISDLIAATNNNTLDQLISHYNSRFACCHSTTTMIAK